MFSGIVLPLCFFILNIKKINRHTNNSHTPFTFSNATVLYAGFFLMCGGRGQGYVCGFCACRHMQAHVPMCIPVRMGKGPWLSSPVALCLIIPLKQDLPPNLELAVFWQGLQPACSSYLLVCTGVTGAQGLTSGFLRGRWELKLGFVGGILHWDGQLPNNHSEAY